MEMPEVAKTIMENGILVIIAAVFLWDKITISKSTVAILGRLESQAALMAKTLEGLHHAEVNTQTALNIIQNTMANLSASVDRHDFRSESMNSDIRAALELLKSRPCVMQIGEANPGAYSIIDLADVAAGDNIRSE